MGILNFIRNWLYEQKQRRKVRSVLAYMRAHPNLEEHLAKINSGPLLPPNITDINKFREI